MEPVPAVWYPEDRMGLTKGRGQGSKLPLVEHLALPLASSVTLGEVPPSLCLLPICKMEITIHVHHRNVCAFNDACVCARAHARACPDVAVHL